MSPIQKLIIYAKQQLITKKLTRVIRALSSLISTNIIVAAISTKYIYIEIISLAEPIETPKI